MNEKITVVIGSCDAYQHLHKNFDILFNRYWKADTENIFASETKGIVGYNNVFTNGPWGYRMLAAINKVNTKYLVFILEDYYLSEPIDNKFLEDHLNILTENNADKIMFDTLYPDGVYNLHHLGDDLYQFDKNSQYLNSVQPAIWRTEYIKQVLQEEYSPWDFEIVGNAGASEKNPKILLKARPKKIYFNFCRRGNILSEGWEGFLQQENLTL